MTNVKITGTPKSDVVRILLESILAWKLHKEANEKVDNFTKIKNEIDNLKGLRSF